MSHFVPATQQPSYPATQRIISKIVVFQLLSALKVISKWIFNSLLRKNFHGRFFSAMENRICILFFIIIVIASKVNGSTQSTYEACQILMTSQLAADLKPSIIRYLAYHSCYCIDHFLGLSTYNECL